jgi:hypothetical protein
VILVLPAVLAAYLVRQGEHAITGRLLAGVRACGLAVAGLALAAAVLVGVGDLRQAVPPPMALNCFVSQSTNGAVPRPVPTPSGLTCDLKTASAAPAQATGLRSVLMWMAVAATALAVLVSLGGWRTWHATRRATGSAVA